MAGGLPSTLRFLAIAGVQVLPTMCGTDLQKHCDGADFEETKLFASPFDQYYFYYRVNPLLDANATAGLDVWAYTKTTQFFFLPMLLTTCLMVLACPCFCGFPSLTADEERSPRMVSAQPPGSGTKYALMALPLLLFAMITLEKLGEAQVVYTNVKCSSYILLNLLVEGSLSGDPAAPGFVGFRTLMNVLGATSATFPAVLDTADKVQAMVPLNGQVTSYPVTAQAYYDAWSVDHVQQLEVTQFVCTLCTEESLQPLADSIDACKAATDTINRALLQTREVVARFSTGLKALASAVLPYVTELYQMFFTYIAYLDDFVEWWEPKSARFDIAFRALAWGVMVATALGAASLVPCCGSYPQRLPLLASCAFHVLAVLLPFASAVCIFLALLAHDVSGLLLLLGTDQGYPLYAPRVLFGLRAAPLSAMARCLVQGGDGNFSAFVNFSLADTDAGMLAQLGSTLTALTEYSLPAADMDAFFQAYAAADGEGYFSSWDSNQTLGWDREPSGVSAISQVLLARSGERWAFEGAQTPEGCAVAAPFNASAPISNQSCWLVTADEPTDAQLEARYTPQPLEQLQGLQEDFQKARASAAALGIAQNFTNKMQGQTELLAASWDTATGAATRALQAAQDGAAAPMLRIAASMLAMASETNCKAAQGSSTSISTSLGLHFVATYVMLTFCGMVLSVLCGGMAALLYGLWEERDAPVYGDGVFLGEEGDTDSELEMQRPLKSDWC